MTSRSHFFFFSLDRVTLSLEQFLITIKKKKLEQLPSAGLSKLRREDVLHTSPVQSSNDLGCRAHERGEPLFLLHGPFYKPNGWWPTGRTDTAEKKNSICFGPIAQRFTRTRHPQWNPPPVRRKRITDGRRAEAVKRCRSRRRSPPQRRPWRRWRRGSGPCGPRRPRGGVSDAIKI